MKWTFQRVKPFSLPLWWLGIEKINTNRNVKRTNVGKGFPTCVIHKVTTLERKLTKTRYHSEMRITECVSRLITEPRFVLFQGISLSGNHAAWSIFWRVIGTGAFAWVCSYRTDTVQLLRRLQKTPSWAFMHRLCKCTCYDFLFLLF